MHEKIARFPFGKPSFARPAPRLRPNHTGHIIMDAERINQIGTNLEDLSTRTAELRRYL